MKIFLAVIRNCYEVGVQLVRGDGLADFKRAVAPRIETAQKNVARLQQEFIALATPAGPGAPQSRTVAAKKKHRRTRVLTASGSGAEHAAGAQGIASTLH